MTVRIHQVSCSVMSGPQGTESFEEAERRATKIRRYAERLGFSTVHDNVDEGDGRDEPSSTLDRHHS